MTMVVSSTYRVVSITTIGFADPKVSESVVWEGTDTDELSVEYPPSDIFGADPLGHSEIEDGLIRTSHRFEKLVDDEWVKIDDPRRRLTPVTALEREIDAENRRLFPGDFIEDEDPLCYPCGDRGCYECSPDHR